jgi:hypothetical protein
VSPYQCFEAKVAFCFNISHEGAPTLTENRSGDPLSAPQRIPPKGGEYLESALKILNTLGVLLIPVVLAFVGNRYNERQKDIDNNRANYDRMIVVLDRLTSEKSRERQEGFMMLQYFTKDCSLIKISLSAMLAHQGDPDPDVKDAAFRLYDEARKDKRCAEVRDFISNQAANSGNSRAIDLIDHYAKNDPSSQNANDVNGLHLPKRVYIEFNDDDQKKKAQEIQQTLIDRGYLVPGIERVPWNGRQTQVRYFHGPEGNEAVEAGRLAKLIPGAESKFIKSYPLAPKDQYELWLAPQTQQGYQAK